ncbi:AfsR/SARP family transcriptional regulator [Paractinoplanes brasiliensis]|uniref:AfsR/SARP family transcriptional regulator n=1 Tax=Paractinoplanes brasiliensis TaxID=52695 RepID=UPI0014150BDF|nr:BTAD domain-containing putative transcriptional regulator [Actinoplanes brasiliensis]
MKFGLLGPLEVVHEGQPAPIRAGKHRAFLAALLLRTGRSVPFGDLVDIVWGDRPPANPRATIQVYATRLRAVVGDLVETTSDGYRITVPASDTDIGRFEDLLVQARHHGERDDPHAESEVLQEALSLWRGEPLADVPSDALHRDFVPQLLELRVRTIERRLDADLRRGRHAELIGELMTLTAQHPLRERLWGQLMTALHRDGRQSEALQAYRTVRDLLADELGIEPGPELQETHAAVLDGRPIPSGPLILPRQLPPAPPGFWGRAGDVARLDAMLRDTGRSPAGAPVIAAVSGTAGVGKTALTVHWAHRVREHFPDGQLYVNLAGYDPGDSLVTPTEAVRGLLAGLGVPAQQVPPDLAEQTALYRSLLADRRMLILLDNARDAEHARPLLPASSGSITLVTSRDALGGLVAEGARPIVLGLLSPDESAGLLTQRIGRPRMGAEPRAVAGIVASCAGLPLALAVVAVRAATNPSFPLSALAAELRDTRDALDALHAGDPASDVRAVLSWSYRALDPDAARLFRLLSLHSGPDIGVAMAASLFGAPARRVRALLAELARVHLLSEHQPGRYGMHDLLRAYATELCGEIDSSVDRRDASGRALEHLVHTGYAAAMLMHPTREPIELAAHRSGVVPEQLAGYEQALDWFTSEHRVMMATLRRAQDPDVDRLLYQLAWTMTTFLLRRGLWHDWVDVQSAALAAARRLGDRAAQAAAHRGLGRALGALGRAEQSDAEYRRALEGFAELGDVAGQATTHDNLAALLAGQGRYPAALAHARQALTLYRAADRTDGTASASNSVAWLLTQVGEPGQAIGHGQESLVLHRAIGDRDGEAATWDTLGYAYHRLGDLPGADAGYRHALALYRELGDRYNIAATLSHLGDTQQAAGDTAAARKSWQEALTVLEALGHPEANDVRARLAGS